LEILKKRNPEKLCDVFLLEKAETFLTRSTAKNTVLRACHRDSFDEVGKTGKRRTKIEN